MIVQAIDYGSSYVTFVTLGRTNNARIQVDARCEWRDLKAGSTETLYLGASCKSEATFAASNLFTQPNYDFCGLFNESQYSIIRTHASAADDRPDVGTVAGRFERIHAQLALRPARLLIDNAAVVAASLAGEPIVCRTTLADPAGSFECMIEYPVKTMNANDISTVFQVDTGPIPFPVWDAPCELTAGRFRLAYIAFNVLDHADFVVLAPTEIGSGVLTPHYSEVVSLPARSEVFALEG